MRIYGLSVQYWTTYKGKKTQNENDYFETMYCYIFLLSKILQLLFKKKYLFTYTSVQTSVFRVVQIEYNINLFLK